MNRLKLVTTLSLLLFIGACQNKGKENVQINNFTTNAETVEINKQVTFSWSISKPSNTSLSCQLDIDGDDANDYSITNCESMTNQQHTYTAIGDHIAKLTATNQGNSSASATTTISIIEPPVKINDFTASAETVEINEEVTFSWSASEAEDGPLSCQIDVDGDDSDDYSIADCKSVISQQHRYTAKGNHVARLTVSNQDNRFAIANTAITIIEPSVKINDFTANPEIAEVNKQITFSWLVSEVGNGPLSCKLDVDGDGSDDYSIANCRSRTSQKHIYTTMGNYVAKLTATNQANNSVNANTNIVITNPSVTIAAVGDIACDPNSPSFNSGKGTNTHCRMEAVAEQIAAITPLAFLPLGDIQYEDGQLWKFEQSYDLSFGQFKDVTYPTVGNHEYLTKDAAGYFQYFGKAAGDPSKGYYSYDLGNWHLISLNSNCSRVGGCGVGSEQDQWLKQDLVNHPTDCTLAYWHHPRFSSGKFSNNNSYTNFWDVLYKAGVEIILVGHDHHYERFAPLKSNGQLDKSLGVRQFIVGTGVKNLTGIFDIKPHSEFRNAETYGFLKLNLHRQSYDWEFISEKGEVLDSGSSNCHF